MRVMRKGPVVTACVAIVAFGAVIMAFSSNASPYVTIAEAKYASGDNNHLAGDILKNTVHMDVLQHRLVFDLRDASGATVHVVHIGEPPANMDEANKVVAVGGMKGSDFVSHQLLVKCPSKYEATKSSSVAQR